MRPCCSPYQNFANLFVSCCFSPYHCVKVFFSISLILINFLNGLKIHVARSRHRIYVEQPADLLLSSMSSGRRFGNARATSVWMVDRRGRSRKGAGFLLRGRPASLLVFGLECHHVSFTSLCLGFPGIATLRHSSGRRVLKATFSRQ